MGALNMGHKFGIYIRRRGKIACGKGGADVISVAVERTVDSENKDVCDRVMCRERAENDVE